MENKITEFLGKHHLKAAIQEMQKYASDFTEVRAAERLENISDDYRLMLDFMHRGFKDEQRDGMFKQLTHRLYMLEKDMMLAEDIRKKSLFNEAHVQASRKHWEQDLIRYSLENFVSSSALLSLKEDDSSKEEQDLYKRHHEFMSVLFRKIWLSYQWNEAQASFVESLLLSPTIDSRDVQLMVSALTLANMTQFDILKFRTLIRVHQHASDEYARQRALVGVAFSLNIQDPDSYDEQKALLAEWLTDETVCRELLELQIQVIYCLNAESDNKKIHSDIMPTLMKNSHLHMTRLGIEEKEDDSLEDILDPGAADRAMEELETSMKRMMDMQKAGSDIYFGGFSMMKNYPFFLDMANWFTPFYLEHPALNDAIVKIGSPGLMKNLVNHGPFCDSDKYSFSLAMSTVIHQMPASIREMMGSSEVFGPIQSLGERTSKPYIRRSYLQDVYRFFRLFPKRGDLENPFFPKQKETKYARFLFFAAPILQGSPLERHVVELGNFLLKQHRMAELNAVVANFNNYDIVASVHGNEKEQAAFLVLKAVSHECLSENTLACKDYEQVLTLNPHHLHALKSLARMRFLAGDYEGASSCYAQLLSLQPDKKSHALNYSATLLKLGKAEEAMQHIYKLDYEHPDDANVQRVKAWGLMSQGKLEQARSVYETLCKGSQQAVADYLNAGYCEWLSGNVSKAVEWFSHYCEQQKDEHFDIQTDFENDAAFLHAHGISDIDMMLMHELL
jgi:tetratricopeptide (TPR) repeat protein